jgi:valyl-tRNA synthetase
VRGVTVALPLGGLIDIPAEKARLSKESEKLKGELAGIVKKLGNADFVARAPEEVVEENRERLEAGEARLTRLAEALQRLG